METDVNILQDRIDVLIDKGFFRSIKYGRLLRIKYFDYEPPNIIFHLECRFGEDYKYKVNEKNIADFEQEVMAKEEPTERLVISKNGELKKNEPMTTESVSTDYTLNFLRSELFDSIKKVKMGTMDDTRAKNIASLSQVVINSIKIELEYRSKLSTNKKIEMIDAK